MKHFDINVYEAYEGVWHASLYALNPAVTDEGENVLSPDTSVTLASVFLTPQEAAELDFPSDMWYGTDSSDFPAVLTDALAVTLDELRAV